MPEQTVWGIHAGRHGEADSLFLQHSVVAIGWTWLGDLSRIGADREAFRAAVLRARPGLTSSALANMAGQPYRFVHEIQPGELVVYRSKQDRLIHIGRVTGPCRYSEQPNRDFPNHRPIEWLAHAPRTRFSQGALYEIGSALTLFRVKTYAHEFRAAADGRAVAPPVETDETLGAVAENVEETTRDYVLKTLAQELKGHQFAELVAHLLNTMGYRTRVSPEGTDAGVDIVAHRDELSFEPPVIKVQVKSTDGSVGDPTVSALYGKVGRDEHGLVVALGTFTPPAKAFARDKTNLRLIDGEELVDLILAHYEQLDSRYKGILRLKRVYVPEPPADEGEG